MSSNFDKQTKINKQGNLAERFFQNVEEETVYVETQTTETLQQERTAKKENVDKKLVKTGTWMIGICFALLLAIIVPNASLTVGNTQELQSAIENQCSDQLPVGVVIMEEEESLEAQDYTITHSETAPTTKIWVWDYADEDGDYVQILVDGVAIGDSFMIKNKPVEIEVPSTGEVQVFGTRDGGGGITYAVNYELNGTTYFNSTDEGNGNLYTLVRE